MDIYHLYGGDLELSPGGDLAIASVSDTGVQRCYRRLLTNPALSDDSGNVIASGDMLGHQDYGAGLGRMVGSPQDVQRTKAIIGGQMLIEQAVSQSPPPTVALSPILNGLSAQIQYVDANTSTPQIVAFDISK